MPKAKKLVIPVEANAQQAIAQLKKVGTQAKKVGAKGQAAGSKMGVGFNKAALGAAALAIAIAGIAKGLKKSIELFAEFEQQQVAFEVLAGNAEIGRNLLDQIIELGRKTPFTTRQVVDVSKKLLAFGFTVRELIPTVKVLGDITAAVGRDKLPFIAKALADVKNKGKLAGQEFLQFANAGVPLIELISKSTGKSIKEVAALREASKITYKEVADALRVATEEGGKFANMMDRQNKTASGQWSEAMDNVEITLRKMGESVVDFLLPALEMFNKEMDEAFAETVGKWTKSGDVWIDQNRRVATEVEVNAILLKKQSKLSRATRVEMRAIRDEKKRIDKEDLATAKALAKAEKELADIRAKQARAKEVADNLRRAKGGFEGVDAEAPENIIEEIKLSEEMKVRIIQAAELEKQKAQKRTKDLEMLNIKNSVQFAIDNGQRLMIAADGQSRALFNIGKALYIAKTIMSGKAAVIETYESFGGYPWGIVPAGIMAGIYLSEVNAIRNMKYNSGATPTTASGVNTFSNFTTSPAIATGGTTQEAIFDDLNSGILTLVRKVDKIEKRMAI